MTANEPTQPERRRGSRILSLRRRTRPGAAPGTVVVDAAALHPKLRVIAYDASHIQEAEVTDVRELGDLTGRRAVTWINVDGLGDAAVLAEVGRVAGLHRLALEDVVNTHQRPKVEDYGDLLFIVVRMPTLGASPPDEQVSLVVTPRLVVSLQERYGDPFDSIRQRLRTGSGRLRASGADYLAYALLDAITDAYFPVVERLGDRLEELEDDVLGHTQVGTGGRIHEVRRELILMRRSVWPTREMFGALLRDGTPVFTTETRVYLRDCYDHTVQVLDLLENYREVAAGLVEVHLGNVNLRMNEIMKVLTVIATLFMPLSFIASVYGMNFNGEVSPWNMPELDWYWGYPFALGLMALVAATLLLYFRWSGWIGRRRG